MASLREHAWQRGELRTVDITGYLPAAHRSGLQGQQHQRTGVTTDSLHYMHSRFIMDHTF